MPRSPSRARRALTDFARDAGAGVATVERVGLAVSEAVTNAVVHAYRDASGPGAVEVTAVVAADELWVIVSDAGSGLRAGAGGPGLGLGLPIIVAAADEADLVAPVDGGVEVRMRFALASADGAAAPT